MTTTEQTIPDLIATADAATLMDVARQLLEAAQPKAGNDSAHVLAQTLNSLSEAECLNVDDRCDGCGVEDDGSNSCDCPQGEL